MPHASQAAVRMEERGRVKRLVDWRGEGGKWERCMSVGRSSAFNLFSGLFNFLSVCTMCFKSSFVIMIEGVLSPCWYS